MTEEQRIQEPEAEGATSSDAQAIIEAEDMQEQKGHTAGPWYTRYGQISSESSTHKCTIANCNATSRGISDKESQANAERIVSCVNACEGLNSEAVPELLEALEYAKELISIARQHFPKSIKNGDRFTLENTCATINKAIAKAKGA